MKIAHVQVIPKLSGVQQISLDILSEINEPNIEKYMICGELENQDFVNAFNLHGVKIISLPSIKRNIGLHDIKSFFQLYKIFRVYQFDIVHTNSTKPGIVARIAARLAGINKIIHTVHGISFHKHAGILNRCAYFSLENLSTLFGSVNVTVNKKYIKYYPFVKSRLVYNGVDFSKLHPVEKKNKSDIHFAFVARLDKQKNPLEFIRAIKLVVEKTPNYQNLKFTLAGSGELENECKALIKDYGLESMISLPGWIADKDSFYNSVDVLCQPSNWEAFGLVFVEAAFYKIPSIARAVEGIPEVILDDQTGMLYSGNEVQLAEKIITYINNPSTIKIMGDNAKNYVCEKFNHKRMIREYFDIYGI